MNVADEVMNVVFQQPETTLEKVQVEVIKRTGEFVDRSEISKAFRALQREGVGAMKLGRKGKETRFILEEKPPKPSDDPFSKEERAAVRELLTAWKLSKKS